jgi:6-phosphogluconolactonase
MTTFWIGSYTADANGSGAGISLVHRDATGALALDRSAPADSPSWVVQHPSLPVVYAALEPSGAVQAFAPDAAGALRPMGSPVTAGDSVCHVSVTGDSRALIAACWGDGRVVSYALDARGAIDGEPRLAAASRDSATASADRPSRAHTSLELADGTVLTTDLGHDSVRVWRRRGAVLTLDHEVHLTAGSGPRHLAAHPSGHVYVVTEYSNEVVVLASSDDAWRVVSTVQAAAEPIAEGDAAAEISLSATGAHLHVGIRGSNRIATFGIDGDGARLSAIADVASGGDWPRHHAEDGRWLHVANERSGGIASFELDEWGVPGRLAGVLEIGTPTSVTPARV